MKTLSLSGSWSLYKADDHEAIPATVPGCVHLDLMANDLLPDPFFRDNEVKQMWIGETDWRYERTFDLTADFLLHERLLLRCHGLDTIAVIMLNGIEIGRADNMFRLWEFDVKPVARVGENRLVITFAAPMVYARQMDADKGAMAGWVEPMRINSGAWIRKQPSNFGWDWGPKMVTSGIWRPIEIVGYDETRLTDVTVLQRHDGGQVSLTVTAAAESSGNQMLTAVVTVSRAGVVAARVDALPLVDGRVSATLAITDPELWWVCGLGDQPLYDVTVLLFDAQGREHDRWTRPIGLRTLTLERHPQPDGESFFFACNGVPFFAKGANWIPATPYPGQRVDYAGLLGAAADAHMNMIRVWGGGVYEDDVFYAVCDQLGLAVWQDFMFACGTYPAFDAEFMANVAVEARENVRRLRHHACLALWCGNNEIEQGMSDPTWEATLSWEQYSLLFDDLLGSITRELAPQTAYWPGSPHTPIGDRRDHQNPDAGDTHLWGVWHGKQPFEWYHTRPDRFVSEFGFQSFPEPATIAEFTLPEDRNITSYVMEQHQRSHIGNVTIIHYMLDWFRLPTRYEDVIWLSQILQGMAMAYAVEGWRRNMPRSMGALYWQLNDMWPAPSWSSLDWKGNWKALHYMARRFFAPVLVSGVEDTTAKQVAVHVTNDTRAVVTGEVIVTITDAAGAPLAQHTIPVAAAPGASVCVQTVDAAELVAQHSDRDLLVWLALTVDGKTVSEDLLTFCRPKHLKLRPAAITVASVPSGVGEYMVTLTADAAALYVWLELPGARCSDNFVHLRPHQPVTIRVQAADVSGLVVRSLVDTYTAP